MLDPRILIALDYDDQNKALALVDQLQPSMCRLKVGKEMFTHFGPAFVEKLQGKGFDVFLDLKFHDIPNTVAKACQAAADLGVWMVNVHAMGGRRMMMAAREALEKAPGQRPLLIAVTVLTSMDEDDLRELGIMESAESVVNRLTRLTKDSGLDGVVCSAREARLASEVFEGRGAIVTPGIRPSGSDAGDQKRVVTPVQALADGSSYLVIGRPITQAPDPQAALSAIHQEVSAFLQN